MEWETIRTRYALLLAEARRAGVTQKSIAERGHLTGQNAISKLLANKNLGPSVETFVRAVQGLGLEVSEFFATIEREAASSAPPSAADKTPLDRIEDLERALGVIAASSSSSLPPSTSSSQASGVHPSPETPSGRSHGVATLSGAGLVNYISTVDIHQFEAVVKASFEMLADRLERLTERLERRGGADGVANPGAPAPRATHRRRARESA